MEQSAIALLESREQQQSQIMINGVPQGGQLIRVYYLKCSNCNRILGQFNPGEPLKNVVAYTRQEFSKNFIYCPTCGCKLNYTCDIIEYKSE